MKPLRFSILLCFIFIFASWGARAANEWRCEDTNYSDYPDDYAVIEKTANTLCPNFSLLSTNSFFIKKPNNGGEKVCQGYRFPLGFAIIAVGTSEECRNMPGPSQRGPNYTIKKPHPAGEDVCIETMMSTLPTFSVIEYKPSLACSHIGITNNTMHIVDENWLNTSPSAPKNFSVIASSGSAKLQWKDSSTATGEVAWYQIQILQQGAVIKDEKIPSGTLEKTYDLEEGNYTFQIRAIKTYLGYPTLSSSYVTITSNVTPIPAPKPNDFLAVVQYNGNVYLSWSIPIQNIDHLDSFRIEWSKSGIYVGSATLGKFDRNYNVAIPSIGIYTFKIYSMKGSRFSELTTTTANVQSIVTPIPTYFSWIPISDHSVQLRWGASLDADKFIIKWQLRNSDGITHTIDNIPGDSRVYILDNLYYGLYDIELYAVRNGQSSAAYKIGIFIYGDVVTNEYDHYFGISLMSGDVSISVPRGYDILNYQCNFDNDGYTEIYFDGSYMGALETYGVMDIGSGVDEITLSRTAGDFLWCDFIARNQLILRNLITSIDGNNVTLGWTPGSYVGIEGYVVSWMKSSTEWDEVILPADATTHIFSNLPNGNYIFEVRTIIFGNLLSQQISERLSIGDNSGGQPTEPTEPIYNNPIINEIFEYDGFYTEFTVPAGYYNANIHFDYYNIPDAFTIFVDDIEVAWCADDITLSIQPGQRLAISYNVMGESHIVITFFNE